MAHSSRSAQTATLIQVNDINFGKCQTKRCTPRRMNPSRDLGPLKYWEPLWGPWKSGALCCSPVSPMVNRAIWVCWYSGILDNGCGNTVPQMNASRTFTRPPKLLPYGRIVCRNVCAVVIVKISIIRYFWMSKRSFIKTRAQNIPLKTPFPHLYATHPTSCLRLLCTPLFRAGDVALQGC